MAMYVSPNIGFQKVVEVEEFFVIRWMEAVEVIGSTCSERLTPLSHMQTLTNLARSGYPPQSYMKAELRTYWERFV